MIMCNIYSITFNKTKCFFNGFCCHDFTYLTIFQSAFQNNGHMRLVIFAIHFIEPPNTGKRIKLFRSHQITKVIISLNTAFTHSHSHIYLLNYCLIHFKCFFSLLFVIHYRCRIVDIILIRITLIPGMNTLCR